MTQNQSLGFSACFASAIFMGTVGVFVRGVDSSAQIITFYRLSLAFIFMAIFMIAIRKTDQLRIRPSRPLIMSGIFTGIAITCYVASIQLTTLATAVFLLFLSPIISTVIAWALLGEKISSANIVIMGVAFVGFLCILDFQFDLSRDETIGYMLGVFSGIFYSFAVISNRMIKSDVPILSRAFYQFAFGALMAFPFIFLSDPKATISDIPNLAAIAFVTSFLGMTLLVLSLRHLEAHKWGTISFTEPIVATVLGFAMFGETLTLLQIFGCVLILGGGFSLVLISRKRGPRCSLIIPRRPPS